MIAVDYEENYVTGWIKVYRSIKNKGWYKKSEAVHLWVHLLIEATHAEREYLWNGKTIILKAGQFITGRKRLSSETGISENKVRRLLNMFKTDQQIDQQTTSTSSLISIINYEQYQINNQQINQRIANEQPTDSQRIATKQELKNDKNDKECKEVLAYLNQKTGKQYKETTTSTVRLINARIKDGNGVADFKKVIDAKCAQWLNNVEMKKFLRPETLFGSKFESYRNECVEVIKPQDRVPDPKDYYAYSEYQNACFARKMTPMPIEDTIFAKK